MDRHIHFIGIGGIGMSGIARLNLSQGIKVSGSDLKETKITAELQNLGVRVFLRHSGANIQGADLVVYSSAIKEDNPEILAAKFQRIPCLKRAQALTLLMQDKTAITVTGSHGKTTIASLASYLLLGAGLNPTAAIGGILVNIDTNACQGSGEFFVAEADESDGSFLYYRPQYSIVTNIDYEHLDYYRNFENALRAYRRFIKRTREGGCLFACSDDKNLREILSGYKNRYVLFGLENDQAGISAKNIRLNGLSSEFDCFYDHKFIGNFPLALAGRHNVSNALAVIALGLELKIDPPLIKKALANYPGARRRIEIKFRDKDKLVIDDYAHHPTEIKATLAAVKNLNYRRVIAVFQPHRYSRTKLLLDEFARSFDAADYVIVTDIYPAGEAPLEGINGGCIARELTRYAGKKPVHFLTKEQINPHILNLIRSQDLVITLGAGDIVRTCDELVEMLKKQS